MKRFIFILTLLVPLIILSACSEDSNSSEKNHAKQKSDPEVEQDQMESEQTDSDDDDDLFSMGDFENVKGRNDLGIYESGPISFNIKSVIVKRGEINEDFLNGLPEGEIEFIEILMILNSTKDDINFTEQYFQLTTDSGEEFKKPNTLMSSPLDIGYRGSGEYYVTVTNILKKTKADELKSVNFYAKAPTDQKGNPLNEDISVDINFSE